MDNLTLFGLNSISIKQNVSEMKWSLETESLISKMTKKINVSVVILLLVLIEIKLNGGVIDGLQNQLKIIS